jgi:dTDP-4-dehydrorhamnose 3,5-epimerase
MRVTPSAIPEVLLIEPRVFADDRGFFFESYSRRAFAQATGIDVEFVQDNHSRSLKNVLRGLHYQLRQPQGKLVRVTLGAIWDVAVDLRRASPTFGRWMSFELTAASKSMAWIPPGFAHGFLVTSDAAEVQYKTTDYYDPSSERSILWNDPAVAIAWPITGTPIVAVKDRNGALLRDAETFA